MTTLIQQTYFGASIRTFTTSVGWGNQVSTLNVGLVEDSRNGDLFNPVAIGEPTIFEYYNVETGTTFSFGGILKNWRQISNNSTNRSLEVIVEDPREILEGVQLILNGYTGGTYGVPNLYNIYGYLETLGGFGASFVNETGIQWYRVRDAFNVLQATTPIRFRGQDYIISLTELPPIDINYRIAGDHISLMDYISEVCAAGVYDFFFTLETGNVIKLKTCSRRTQPSIGRISSFLTGRQGVSAETGYELRNEVTSKFLVGGNVIAMFLQYYSEGAVDNFADDTIWPFWGFDINRKLIIGNGKFDNPHKFTVDARGCNALGVGATYETNVQELRAALMGQDSWEAFIMSESGQVTSIHRNKATRLGLVGNMLIGLKDFLSRLTPEQVKGLKPLDFAGLNKQNLVRFEKQGEELEENNRRIYEFVRHIASEFYGRKFMVRIPFLLTKREPDTLRVVTSQEPADAAFIDEAVWPNAVARRIIHPDIDFFRQEDDRIVCYVKYNNAKDLDLSDLSPSDYIITNDKRTVFILATLDSKIVYEDENTFFSPRAVISLPGIVRRKNTRSSVGLLKYILDDTLGALPAAERDGVLKNIIGAFGGDEWKFGEDGLAVIPDMVAIPLKSNILKYGPWYAIGAQGKTEFEQDDTLVPWNYGGFAIMNLAGTAKVTDVYSNMQVSENGSIEIPGSPVLNLGDVLISGGPYVTDIECTVGNQVTTRYRMRVWTPQFGKMSRANAERMRKISLATRDKKRKDRLKDRPNKANDELFDRREKYFTNRGQPLSSASLLCGEFATFDHQIRKTFVTASPIHNAITRFADNYTHKVAMSWEALLRPFSCVYNTESTGSSGLPHFESPEVGAKTPDVSDLNPFQYGHDIQLLTRNEILPNNLIMTSGSQSASDEYRALGLRAPLILVGWGRDKSNKPVPNSDPSNPTNSYHSDYLRRPDLWKAGPLDARWDHERKVWIAGGAKGRHGVLMENILPGGSGRCRFYERTSETDDIQYVFDFMMNSGQALYQQSKVFVMEDEDGYNYVWSANCPG